MIKYQFQYSMTPGCTVTVKANDYEQACYKARTELDRRYEKAGKEPPVGWTLWLLKETEVEPDGRRKVN
jgi:hypothetical protein